MVAEYNEPLPLSMYAPLVLLQMISSFCSVVGSFVIIRIATPKMGSTYQRFLFMLSSVIVINAIFLFLHPLLVPKGSSAWGIGNDATCSLAGFFWVFGALAVSLYHNALALYFNFSIYGNDNNNNKERKPEDVVGCVEIMVNVTCWLIPLAIAIAGAATTSINFDPKLDMCVLYQECDPDETNDGSCVPIAYDSFNRYGTSASVTLQQAFQWILVASAILSLLILVNLQCQVRRAMKTTRIAAQQLARDEMDLDGADEQQQIIQKLAAVSAQCILYTFSYLNSYVWFIILLFIPANNPNLLYAFQVFVSMLYPMVGVFNAVVYIRPRLQMLKLMYPQDPFVVVVRVAMSKAGDEVEIEAVRKNYYGSDYCGSEEHAGSEAEESRDSAIPSVVHFDPEEKPLSIKSLVSIPGGEEGDTNHGHNSASLLSPLPSPDVYGDGSMFDD
ncbi:MAG: hypothetical protein SGILL_000218 [Bacillariaceae sp.]